MPPDAKEWFELSIAPVALERDFGVVERGIRERLQNAT